MNLTFSLSILIKMTSEEVTKEFGLCIKNWHEKNQTAKYHMVKDFLERGADLSSFDDCPLLIYALNSLWHPSIIKLLIDKDGVDWNYRAYYVDHLDKLVRCGSTSNPNCKHTFKVFADYVIGCVTIKNVLFNLYYLYTGSVKLINKYIIEHDKSHCKKYGRRVHDPKKVKPQFNEVTEKEPIPENPEKYLKYLKEYCRLLGFDYNSLDNVDLYELPEDVCDFTLVKEENGKLYNINRNVPNDEIWPK